MSNKFLGLKLSVNEDGKDSRIETFTQESVTVGAGSSADLKIEGDQVSDIHAMFDASRGNEIFIMDLGSASGTFVNDKKVNKQKLSEGDSIKLGNVNIEVQKIGDVEEDGAAVVVEETPEPAVEAKEETEAETVEETPAETEKEEVAAEAKTEENEVEAEVSEEQKEVEAKAEEKTEKKSKKDKKKDKKQAKDDSTEEEKKALEEKQAAFEAKKAKARSKKYMYDLNAIPDKHVPPSGNNYIFEAREVLWGDTLLNVSSYKSPRKLTFGESKRCDFFCSSDYLPGDVFTVANQGGSGFAMNFTKSMEGEIRENSETYSFADAIKNKKAEDKGDYYQLKMTSNIALTYKFGEIQFYFHRVTPEKLDKVPFTKRIDYPITILMVLFLLFYTLMTVYIKSLPAPEFADILDAPDRFAKLILEPVEMEEPEELPEEIPVEESEEASLGEEGKVGEEESQVDKAEGSERKRLEDQKVADSSGILGALDKGMESMDRLFGGGGLGAGLEKTLGMMEGISGMDMRGAGGLGSRGSGLGGGGTALGIGGLGTKGRGGGKGGRYGVNAAGRLKKHGSKIKIGTGNASIKGALDKSIIARIIKKHYSQIRYCYQKELNRNPKLYGKISIKFVISPRGTVSSSVVRVSTMKNATVEQCVAKVIKRIMFPQPKGGGIVQVTYPFIFKSEGSN